MSQKLTVAVLMGGPSAEHEVSLASGEVVTKSLDSEKYDTFPVIITRGGEWTIPIEEVRDKADIAFIALHGEYGEDGTVQELLHEAEIPYTGSDMFSSALAMNKIISARLLSSHGIKVPRFVSVHKHEKVVDPFDHFGYPIVVKPANRGSSVGMTIVRNLEELGNEKGCCPHNRWREHAAKRGSGLYRPRVIRPITGLFHERDCDLAGCGHIGRSGA